MKDTTNYNLRSHIDLTIPSVKLNYKVLNWLKYNGVLIWNSLPVNVKNNKSL